jgi:hypothetical protein
MVQSLTEKKAMLKYTLTHRDERRALNKTNVAIYYLKNSEAVKKYNNRRHAWRNESARMRQIYECMV